jgi:type IV pilus assembly protein PilW
MKPRYLQRGVRGLSLIELMISIALGAVILTAVGYVFSGSRASYRQQENLSAVQEAGRIAMELMARDIRMAGFTGCGSLGSLQFETPTEYANDLVIVGTANQVTVRRGSTNNAFVVSPPVGVTPAANEMWIRNASALGTLAVNHRLMVTDCVHSEVFEIADETTDLNGSAKLTASLPAGLPTPFVRQYRADSLVMRTQTVTYSLVGNNLIRNENGAAQPLVSGVTALNFTYGIDTDDNRSADAFVPATTAANTTQVVAVRVNLTIQEGDVTQTFSSTITLRNRAP